jgi:hypothetical protein
MRSPRALLAAVAVAVAASLAALPVTGADAKPAKTKKITCRSGVTVLQDGQTRLFRVRLRTVHPYRFQPKSYNAWYLCSAWVRKPRIVDPGDDEWESPGIRRVRVIGSLIAYLDDWNDPSDSGTMIGWVDPRTGHGETIEILGPGSALEFTLGNVDGFTVRDDGSIALVGPVFAGSVGAGQAVVFIEHPAGKPLSKPRIIARVPAGDVVPSSLAFGDGTVTWTTKSGAPGSAAL